MEGPFNSPQTPALVGDHRHHAPGSWHDLKRDWQRWSRTERVAAECACAALVIGGALMLAVMGPF